MTDDQDDEAPSRCIPLHPVASSPLRPVTWRRTTRAMRRGGGVVVVSRESLAAFFAREHGAPATPPLAAPPHGTTKNGVRMALSSRRSVSEWWTRRVARRQNGGPVVSLGVRMVDPSCRSASEWWTRRVARRQNGGPVASLGVRMVDPRHAPTDDHGNAFRRAVTARGVSCLMSHGESAMPCREVVTRGRPRCQVGAGSPSGSRPRVALKTIIHLSSPMAHGLIWRHIVIPKE